ncbi:hypothetical protein [Microbacterium terrisoli]|uniref:hypothetical protein n=1 Tax=Microbacterium terrisoli TaxID=3242192 RepID=UPI00280568DF|nr:hypothetical protein [Microbacterium protaetiae]
MASINTAKSQARSIGAAINGQSSAMQTLGNVGRDPHPERLLAVGLAHAQNALGELIKLIEEQQEEIDQLRPALR